MKGKFYIVGMGMGYSSLTINSLKAIDHSSIIIFTSQRLLNSYKKGINKDTNSEIYVTYKVSEINEILKKREMGYNISIIISGDVGFYSFALQYKESDAIFCPGISSLVALSSRFHLDYSSISVVSIHARNHKTAISSIRRNRYSFILLSKSICNFIELLKLYDWGDLTVYIGSDMGGEHEQFSKSTINEIKDNDFLKSIIIENPSFDNRLKIGINDNLFLRDKNIPMTKSSVRSVVLSTLSLNPTDTVWDIGCGSGSISVEIGLSIYNGWLYALDVKKEAIELTENNLIKAKIANYSLICSKAPNGLDEFKTPDVVFIGGSNGNIESIINYVIKRNSKVKIVLTVISLDTLSSVMSLNIDWNIIQLQSSKAKKIGNHHIMKADNPIFILSTGGCNE